VREGEISLKEGTGREAGGEREEGGGNGGEEGEGESCGEKEGTQPKGKQQVPPNPGGQ
jgi:hypothetical protein